MFQKTVISFLVALTFTISCLPLAAQTRPEPENVPALLVKANNAYLGKDYPAFRAAMEKLRQLRPNNSEYMYQMVIAHALLDDKSQAYNLMLRMQQQGLSYDFTATDDTLNIRDTQVFEYVNDLMKIAGDPMGESERVFVLPDEVVMPDALAWDESRQKFLVGTIAGGQVFAVGKDGEVSELLKADAENGLWAIIDILVDAPRNRLWVSSASMPGFSRFDPVERGRSALFEFNLETLDLLQRYPVPVDGQPHILGSMVLNPAGEIYIADRALPLVYSKAQDEQKLKPLLALRELVSQRGIAMQPDGRILYVADREMGIMVIDLQARQARLLEIPETLNLGGIDGLYLNNNRLFVIQNGIRPQRVMRLQLDASGTKVETVSPLAVAQPEFDSPSFGSIEGDHLYYFGNSQWSGKAESQKPVSVLRTPLESGADLVQPDMQLYLEKQAERARQAEQEKNN